MVRRFVPVAGLFCAIAALSMHAQSPRGPGGVPSGTPPAAWEDSPTLTPTGVNPFGKPAVTVPGGYICISGNVGVYALDFRNDCRDGIHVRLPTESSWVVTQG